MIAQVEQGKHYSLAEYLELEVQAETRHEYINGEIIPMTGGMPNHNQIAGNFYSALNYAFRGQPYRAFFADQRLWIPKKKICTYPDVMVVQGALQLQEGRRDTITNPLVIVEVLSESTADYDRGNKFLAYRTIPSFREYVLVDQYSVQVEQYVKTGVRKWEFQEYNEADSVIRLETLNLDLSLSDLYDKVEFAPVETETPSEQPE